MKKTWISVFFISMMWLFLLPVFTRPSRFFLLFLLIGLGLNIRAFWGWRIHQWTPYLYLFFIPIIFFTLTIHFPFNLGGILLLLGGFLAIFHKNPKISSSFSLGFLLTGTIILLQTAVLPFFFHFASRYHRIVALNHVFNLLTQLSGLTASYDTKNLLISTADGVSPVAVSWEALGLFPALMLLIGSIALLIFIPSKVKKPFLTLFGITMGYMVLRFQALLFFFADSRSTSIFWKPGFVILSFFLLPVILSRFIHLETKDDKSIKPIFGKFRVNGFLTGTIIFFGIFFLIGFWNFNDPGIKKEGRILIDEAHSNWEWTEKKYDTDWYGQQSGYNYYCLKEFLANYYHVNINKDKITADILNEYDILIIKTPTQFFLSEEAQAIKEFVKRGGGVFLIGDHTNVFGMGTYLNPIAGLFGFRFKYDATYDLKTLNLSLFNPQEINVISHPVLNHIPFFLFATSCSLRTPLFSENVILGYGLKSLDADYSQRNFFPRHSDTDMEFGLFVQMGGIKYKNGRVLLFTDSTCFSNFSMFMPGKPELILGSIEWLNRRNKLNFMNKIFFILASICVILFFILRSSISKMTLLSLLLFSSLLAVSLGKITFDRINRMNYPFPKSHTHFHEVSFDLEHSSFYIPAKEFKYKKDTLETFYIWTQRLGIVPNVKFEFEECLKDNAALVIVNPTKPFKEEEILKFKMWIEEGGRALIMDDPRRRDISTAHQLLSPFGMSLEYYEIENGIIVDKNANEIWEGEHLGVVKGGDSLCYVKPVHKKEGNDESIKETSSEATKEREEIDKSDLAILAVTKKGKGMLVVFGCSSMFFNKVMGLVSTIPNNKLKRIYEFEYWIFRDLLEISRNGKN